MLQSVLHPPIQTRACGRFGHSLHPHTTAQLPLLTLGFGEFVARVHKEKRNSVRLFWRTAHGADGQASTVFSKWFARLLDKSGLTDPGLVFHSFRHHAEDCFRNALLPQTVIDRIIGHSDGSTSAGYGEGVWLETAYEAVKAMRFRVRLPEILRQEHPANFPVGVNLSPPV